MAAAGKINTTHNFSVRDIAGSQIPLTVITSSTVRRQRGSRDLRHDSLDDLNVSSACHAPRTSSRPNKESRVSSTSPCRSESSVYSCDELGSPLYPSPSASFFEEDSDDEDKDAHSEPDVRLRGPSCWPPNDEWPLTPDEAMPFPGHDKDSAFNLGRFNFAPGNAKHISSGAVTISSDVAYQELPTRPCSVLAQAHEPRCICTACRQKRHSRRKSSLCLFSKLEDCRNIMTTIRAPQDPINIEQDVAYGHWLKLARLYVKYETLLDDHTGDFDEEEKLFLDYVQEYNRQVELVRSEGKQWSHLFEGRIDTVTVASRRSGTTQVIDVGSNSKQVDKLLDRVHSWTLETRHEQDPIGNCRAVGSNFF